jgi:hypothetical protein
MTINLQERLNELKAQQGEVVAPAGYDLNNLAPAKPAASVRGSKIIPNRYGGKCVRCNVWVPEQKGSIHKVEGRWLVSHVGECPEAAAPPAAPAVPEEGLYVLEDGRIVKVQSNKAKTNRYSSVWVEIGGHRLTETGEFVQGEWEYAPALRGACKPEARMTMEQAKEFGVLYGQCAKCGRHLKDAESVERGIGPVCARSFSA